MPDPSQAPTQAGTAGTGDSAVPAPGAPVPEPPGAAPPEPPQARPPYTQRIYWLDILGNGVFTARADGSEMMRLTSALAAPDGVVYSDCTGELFFTNMGSSLGGSGRASVQRWHAGTTETIVAPGSGINTAKQLALDRRTGLLYVADREGATIWRVDPGSREATPIVLGHGFQQLVGVVVDSAAGHVYFTDRLAARIYRVGLQMPAGQSAENRTDVELLYQAPAGAMPIDLALDYDADVLYLTDRQLGMVQRMGKDLLQGETPDARSDVEVVLSDLVEPIGVAVMPEDDLLYVTELSGAVHRSKLDGSGDTVIARTGSATGIVLSVMAEVGGSHTCD
jgi:sugar lactone lactonase YvrE